MSPLPKTQHRAAPWEVRTMRPQRYVERPHVSPASRTHKEDVSVKRCQLCTTCWVYYRHVLQSQSQALLSSRLGNTRNQPGHMCLRQDLLKLAH